MQYLLVHVLGYYATASARGYVAHGDVQCIVIYRSFRTYRTRFSQVFSYIMQLRRKDSRESCVTL